jgi:hypothetical protein
MLLLGGLGVGDLIWMLLSCVFAIWAACSSVAFVSNGLACANVAFSHAKVSH